MGILPICSSVWGADTGREMPDTSVKTGEKRLPDDMSDERKQNIKGVKHEQRGLE